jgi:DNA polymerase-3 subunit gamma/tau
MAVMAFYLKYRPQTIGDLDIVSVRQGLAGVLQRDVKKELPHALLFTGPRGTGKTSSARIVAKAINCNAEIQNPESGSRKKKIKSGRLETKSSPAPFRTAVGKPGTAFEPCNQCTVCQTITAGHSLDVIEIDAASHRGIDDIRDLREKVRLAPVQFRYKVYIIDEVHMLTSEAFNALLKTLEEPPANVVFILCTTELHKLPQTIISRCVQILFNRATIDDLVHSLQRVVNGEKLEIEDAALQVIAKFADGSFRDAHKILEQLSWQQTVKAPQITLEQVKLFIGLSENRVQQMVNLISLKKVDEIIALIEEIVNQGENLKIIFQQVIYHFHQIFLQQTASGNEKAGHRRSEIRKLSSLIRLLDRALYEMKTSVIPQLPIELAIFEWERLSLRRVSLSAGEVPMTIGTTKQSESVKQASHRIDLSPALRNPDNDEVTLSASSTSLTQVENSKQRILTLPLLQQKWDELINAIKPHNHSLNALLRSTRPQQVIDEKVIIEVWYPFHFERLNAAKSRQIVEQTICDHLQCSTVRVEYRLSQKQPDARHTNGNMIPEEQIPVRSPVVGSQRPFNQVRDNSSQGYRPRATGSSRTNYRQPSSLSSDEEDEALIKFAEDLFGG